MNQPIIFLSPPEFEGKTGVQVVDDDTHEVTAVLLDETGEDVSRRGVSYRDA